MIEKMLLDYLGGALSVPVYMERPENPPLKFVLLEKTGSGEINHIQTATIAAQSYAPSMYEAAALSREVVIAMREAVTVTNISRAALNSEYNFTDTSKKEYRYQAVFDVTYHE